MSNINIDDYRAIIIPSHDRRSVPETLKTILEAIYIYQKRPALVSVSSSGLLWSRTTAFRELKKIFNVDKMRGFMIDSDIILQEKPETIVEYMKKADNEKVSFIAPYKVLPNFHYAVSLDGSTLIDDLSKLKEWQKVKAGGLGFYYGILPLDYVFHADPEPGGKGEDFNFYIDNKITPRIAKNIKLIHLKLIPI